MIVFRIIYILWEIFNVRDRNSLLFIKFLRNLWYLDYYVNVGNINKKKINGKLIIFIVSKKINYRWFVCKGIDFWNGFIEWIGFICGFLWLMV